MEDPRTWRPGSFATNEVPLPPERAFVVQLRPLADPGNELFVGRVEHIASGAVFRFRSAAELTAFIAQVVDPLSGPPASAAKSGASSPRDAGTKVGS